MPKQLVNITGYEGVDTTTDPYILGKDNPKKSSLSYNFRAKNGVRVGRYGYSPVIQGSEFKRSGVCFPYGAKAILPNTKLGANLANNFYVAGSTAFSIEFLYKGEFQTFDRYACNVPIRSGALMQHMTANFFASDSHTGETNLELQFVVNDGGLQECTYSFFESFPMDNEWHHVALTRSSDGSTVVAYLDAATTPIDYDTSSDGSTAALLSSSDIQEGQDEPLFEHHLQIGDSSISIAEFRIWSDERTWAEIAANYNVSLTGSEDGLVCYVPFDEADGNHFTEAVNSTRGYFSPQEPYVNDDNEMVFTGYKCLAIPSQRSRRVNTDFTASDETAYHYLRNEDGGYDGGILWDPKILFGADHSEFVNAHGFLRGTAQLRIRLRQLKEGVICGRLCMVYSETYDKYYLGYYHTPQAAGSDQLYQFDGGDGSVGGIDESWIGVEKTITLKYDGIGGSLGDASMFTMYIETTSVTATAIATPTWSSGDAMDATDYRPFTQATLDTVELDNDFDGAIGGSPKVNAMCIAFDLLFFRQWWEQYPTQSSSDFATFVANTYDQDDLSSSYKQFSTGVSGNILDNTLGAIYLDITSYLPFSGQDYLQYVKMPIHYGSDEHAMDGNTTEMSYAGGTFKQDVLIKRIVNWQGWGGYWLYTGDSDLVQVDDVFGTKRRFNDGVISNLVNYYNSETFKNNQEERPVFYGTRGYNALTDIAYVYEKNLRLQGVIEDDTPLQGIETFFGIQLKSKYLILSGTSSRTDTIYKQRSLKWRWCTGPIDCASDEVMPVRGITRFVSEDGKINKLIAACGCSVMTIDEDAGTATPNEWGWLDRNDDAPVNFITLNNRCVIMDDKSAIKINAKGNFSRLGVERPMAIDLSTIETVTNDTFKDQQQFAYSVQYYDTENDVYSGTIPIAKEYGQQIFVDGSSSGAGVDHFEMKLRGCKDANVDRFLAYRTANMSSTSTPAGTGAVALQYLVKNGGSSRIDNYVKFRDVWTDTEMASNPVLSANHYGIDLVPSPSEVANSAYGRLFLFGTDDATSTLRWSNVTSLGLGKPDEVHPLSSLIVEEGGTTKGTGLIEYNGVLYAFKEYSIFKVAQYAPGQFEPSLLYKGVGAVNQACVTMAGDSIMFLDKTGLYAYRGGEPRMLSTELVDYFRTQVNQSSIDKSFILHNKAEEQVLCFVPGSLSTYPDRCVVYDLRTNRFTIDLTPVATCGYIDDTTIYLGTPYGKILSYSNSVYVDVVDTEITKADVTVASLTITKTSAFPNDGTTLGARVFIYDSDQKVWTGTIDSELSANQVAVSFWEPLLGTTSTSPTSGATMMLGHLYFHDKSPQYSFFEASRDKVLHEYSLTTNRVAAASILLLYEIDINDGGTTVTGYKVLSGYLNDIESDFQGAHRNYCVTNAGFYTSEFRWKETTHSITYTQGRQDY